MTPDLVRQVAAHHRAALIALSHEWRLDPRAVTGLAWGLRALDRVLAACDGETDLVALGLQASPPPTVQPDLFGAATIEPSGDRL